MQMKSAAIHSLFAIIAVFLLISTSFSCSKKSFVTTDKSVQIMHNSEERKDIDSVVESDFIDRKLSGAFVHDLTHISAEVLGEPIQLEFSDMWLTRERIPAFDPSIVDTVVSKKDFTNFTQVFYSGAKDDRNGFGSLLSYLDISGNLYQLSEYLETPYDATEIRRTKIKAANEIFAYDIIKGAAYHQRQYFVIEDDIPYIIARIDCAVDTDIDGDGWDETLYSHGLPMSTKIFIWEADDNKIKYADLNAALHSQDVDYSFDDERIFVALYRDDTDEKPIPIILQYFGGCLDRIASDIYEDPLQRAPGQ
ncbi:MAG: hypothetical protein LBS51_02540 [Oscillospiraceae bacterium]|jgi:hypothetical protein|nr:hypothetical protein [Oscillospiraceae bacterium]